MWISNIQRQILQGTSKTAAEFDIGLLGIKFKYFLKLTHEPKFSTLTWTLDYSKNSDFGKDDHSYKYLE